MTEEPTRPPSNDTLLKLVGDSLERRSKLLAELHASDTTLYRLFHGATEGYPGVTVDRYGPNLLVQSWREPPSEDVLRSIRDLSSEEVGARLGLCWYDRSKRGDMRRPLVELADARRVGSELGLKFDAELVHRGIDPLLFLDFRVARREVARRVGGKSVLNLFAYTCGIGVAALAGGASEVLNVDFAEHALGVGRGNAALNDLDEERFGVLREECLPVMRQLSGLGVKGKAARRSYTKLRPREFDLVVLDPPRYAKSPFGLVDTVNDYQSLFKPALLSTRPGGEMLVTNNVASVALDDWLESLKRCALKAGRNIEEIEILRPEVDFPTFEDEHHPLKLAWLTLGSQS